MMSKKESLLKRGGSPLLSFVVHHFRDEAFQPVLRWYLRFEAASIQLAIKFPGSGH